MKRVIIVAAALAAFSPATLSAQQAPSAVPSAPASATLAPVDPVRLAAARPVIDRIWPLGTYARIMKGTMDQLTQSTMSSMYDIRMDDIAGAKGKTDAKGGEAVKGKTVGEVMSAADPYFLERQKITMNVMIGEMTRVMSDIEPEVREAIARSYARRFTVVQLSELDRFFATPTGAAYASEAMILMAGPDMTQAMQAFVPRLLKEMPAMMEKVKEATKHLPPPPKKASKQ